ncbi:endo alpha-1,4 polygalactosaminidase [Pendulispora albinea]|uniref:Endo alpha-1,4 polygalactosaminidase n=1 Tax=Pendulispora albinea TaxID=2741071 RepID=A0ABZ2LWN3_9BACT
MGPGFPESGPWVSFYGTASKMRDLAKVARTFRIINIDADPDNDGGSNFTDAQLATLRAGGKNRVLSYLNLGACERTRSYWSHAPAPFVPCAKNKGAQLGAYAGYADEVWMDPSNAPYQALMVDFVAARLAARKIDGFYLDNLEVIEHPKSGPNGPCSAQCKQGGLDLVKRLRDKFPDLLLVMQNATGRITRLGVTGGVRFATLLDGIAHEEVYAPRHDPTAETELLAWKQMNIRSRNGHPLWIATEDYAGSCANQKIARDAWSRSQRHGFSPYISDESGGQNVVCYWPF